MNENDNIKDWDDFVETDSFKEEVKTAAEENMCEVEREIEAAMDEVHRIIMTELENNHEELGDPDDYRVREAVEDIAADVLHNWLARRNF